MMRRVERLRGHVRCRGVTRNTSRRRVAGGSSRSRSSSTSRTEAEEQEGKKSTTATAFIKHHVLRDRTERMHQEIFKLLPRRVSVVEVGPRDGLQNERTPVSTAQKIELVERLQASGLASVEAASFVSPKWVPQMADGAEVLTSITKRPGVHYPVLTPNLKGYEAALAAGAEEVAIFGSASETFSQKNINCSIEESFGRFEAVVQRAALDGVRVRGYVSCVLGCPYEGVVSSDAVFRSVARLLELGCYEVSLGDTIGVGTAGSTHRLLEHLLRRIEPELLAAHFHDTYGQALANLMVALTHGIDTIDSSVSGLGGCPYAPAASGNVATEDVVYMLHGLGVETGVDLDKLVQTSKWVSGVLGRDPASRVATAMLAKQPATDSCV